MYYIKHERKKIKGVKAAICLMLLLLLLAAIDIPVKKVLRDSSAARAKISAAKAVNDAVTEVLKKGDYGEMVYISMSQSDKVSAVVTDTAKINAFKTDITKAVEDMLGGSNDAGISIPLGTLLKLKLLTGRGPDVNIKIRLNGSVVTDLTSTFISVGINQTRHRVTCKINADVMVIIPGCTTQTTVSTEYLVAETVIVGDIPDSYTNVNGDDSGIIGQIFDYADRGE